MGLRDCIQEMGPLGRWLASMDAESQSFFTSRDAAELRSRLRLDLKGGVQLDILEAWNAIGSLMERGEPGLAFREARNSLASIPELVSVEEVGYRFYLDRMLMLLDPFVVTTAEVRCALAPAAEDYFSPSTNAGRRAAAEYINVIRRALIDLGVPLWVEPVADQIDGLREQVEDFMEAQNFLALTASEEADDRCGELLDRVAGLESSLAHGLMRLFRFNAQTPEVRWRFAQLWHDVETRREEDKMPEALTAAHLVLDEAFALAGLDFEELLDRIDLVADVFSEADALRTAVLVAESMPEGEPSGDMEREFLAVIEQALHEMGLDLSEYAG